MIECKCLSCNSILPYDELWFARKRQHILHHKKSIKSRNKIWCDFPLFVFGKGGEFY